jgi:16S rRNA (guanine1207-N2)-methyltransferase
LIINGDVSFFNTLLVENKDLVQTISSLTFFNSDYVDSVAWNNISIPGGIRPVPLADEIVFEQSGIEFGVEENKFDTCIIIAGRCFEQNLIFLSLAQRLAGDCLVSVVCPNSLGARRLEKEFSLYWNDFKTLSKFHGRLFWSHSGPLYDTEIVEENNVFMLDVLRKWHTRSSYNVIEGTSLVTSPGNFSWESVDRGSQLLIDVLREKYSINHLSGRAADLGAGYGFLAKEILACSQIEKIYLFESDRLALNNARRNVNDSRAEFIWCDVLSLSDSISDLEPEGALSGKLDLVLMNPPFHNGRTGEVSLELGRSFFRVASMLLRPKGKLFWVANDHLSYQRDINLFFSSCDVLHRASGFVVGLARK